MAFNSESEGNLGEDAFAGEETKNQNFDFSDSFDGFDGTYEDQAGDDFQNMDSRGRDDNKGHSEPSPPGVDDGPLQSRDREKERDRDMRSRDDRDRGRFVYFA